MHQFKLPLQKGDDPDTDLPVLGFPINGMFIFDPFKSECGRFEVDPTETYGLSIEDASQLAALNELVDTATQAALNVGCQAVQKHLGIESGDLAGVHFSSSTQVRPVALAVRDYIEAEYASNRA